MRTMSMGVMAAALSALLGAAAVSAERVAVEATGRRIQRDGFLPEWDGTAARSLGDSSGVVWDVINTSEGLTGYIRFARSARCSSWTFRFYPNMGALQRSVEVRVDTGVGGAFFSVYQWEDDSVGMVTAEWVIPWDTVSLDDSGSYEVGMVALNDCGDTLPAVVMAGRRPEEKIEAGKVLTPRVIVQMVTIAAMLVLYLGLRARAQKYRV